MINTTYQFVTAGDYVNFYVNNNLQFKLSKDSNVICWYFDDQPGIVFKVNNGTFYTGEVEDISFDSTPLTTKDGFVTAIKAMFPVYAGGGAGATPGIDTVLAQAQALTVDRDITLNGKMLRVLQGADFMLVLEPGAVSGQVAALVAKDGTGHTTQLGAYANSDDGYAFSIFADAPDGTKNVDIYGDTSDGSIMITMNGNFLVRNLAATNKLSFNGITGLLQAIYNAIDFLNIDPTTGAEHAHLQAYNVTGSGNQSIVDLTVTDAIANFSLGVSFNGEGGNVAAILGNAVSGASSLTYSAGTHILVGVSEYADNAAAVTAGLTAGALYRTGDALKIVHA